MPIPREIEKYAYLAADQRNFHGRRPSTSSEPPEIFAGQQAEAIIDGFEYFEQMNYDMNWVLGRENTFFYMFNWGFEAVEFDESFRFSGDADIDSKLSKLNVFHYQGSLID